LGNLALPRRGSVPLWHGLARLRPSDCPWTCKGWPSAVGSHASCRSCSGEHWAERECDRR